MKRLERARALAGAFGIAVLVAACTAGGTSSTAQPTDARAGASAVARANPGSQAHGAVAHAVEAAHLREMMAELDYLATTRLPDDVDSASKGESADRDEILADVGDMAEALAGTAGDIPDVLEEVHMAGQDRAHFRELANRLRADALELQERAARRELEPAKQALARIMSTCDACHAAFRVLPNATERALR